MVLYNKKGEIVAVYLPGSEEYWRFHRVLEILFEADKRKLERLLNKKKKQEEQVNQILDEPDKRIIHKAKKRKLKRYNLLQAAKELGVTR